LRGKSGILAPAALIILLVAIWWGTVAASRSPIIPTPWQVIVGIGELVHQGVLLQHVTASLFRVSVGYLLAVALAVPLGLVMGLFSGVFTAVNPVIQLLRPISPIAWIPLSILWFGVGNLSPVFLIFLASFFPMVVYSTAGVHTIDRQYIRASQNFGVSGLKLLRLVILPGALPQIIVGMRISIGVAWLVVVAAEMIALSAGLGFLIMDSRNAGNRYDLVVAGMVMIGVIGLLLDSVMRRLERLKIVQWQYGR
jgi:NitT/TauT family transport system permease protein